MPVYHVKITGGKSSGSSTADDWTDANCYALFSGAIAESGDGDTIILDDEDHVEAAAINGTDWDGTQTIQSRGEDPESCSLSISSATARFLFMNSSNAGYAHIKNIKLSRTVTVTGATCTLIYTSGAGNTGVLLENCIIGDFNLDITGTLIDGAIYRNASGDRADKVRFLNCEIRNIDMECSAYGNFTRFTATQTGYFEGCYFHDITVTNGGTESTGVLFFENAHSVIEDCRFEDITINSAVAGTHRTFLYHSNNAYTATVLDITIKRYTYNADQFSGGMFSFLLCPSTWERVYAEDCTLNVDSEIGDGGVLYLTGDNIDHSVTDMEVHNVKTRSGGAIFCSNGANLTAENIRVYDSQVDIGGAIYLGYNGNLTVNGVYVENVGQYTASQENGKGIFARHSDVAPADDVVYTIANVTVVDCTSDATFTKGIHVQNNHATGTVAANIYNCICRNGGADDEEIKSLQSGAGAITTNTYSCNVEGGADATDVTGNTDLTSADPVLNDSGSLPVGSALSGIGVRWWTGAHPVGADGEPFPNYDIDIGAFQGTDATTHPFHPLNL